MRKSTIWSLMIVSSNLQINYVKLTGLYFTDLFLEPVLNKGMLYASLLSLILMNTLAETASVAEWLRAWDTLTMFEATVCGRS